MGVLRRFERLLPSPFSNEDRARGYRYQLALRQLELSDTRVFDRPQAGRDWFERMIRDQLTLGRPDHVAVVFARKVIPSTPGRFQTRVFNRGDQVALQVQYKHSKVKQYFKEGRALRTETTVNDTRDFGVGRLLNKANWDQLLQIGHDVNERLLDAQLEACACAPDATTLERVVLPSVPTTVSPPPRFASATRACKRCSPPVCRSRTCSTGSDNKSLHPLSPRASPGYTPRQMTYDLRRLRRKGFVTGSTAPTATGSPTRAAGSPSSSPRPTPASSTPSLAELDPALPAAIATRSPLARSWRAFEQALDTRIADAALTA